MANCVGMGAYTHARSKRARANARTHARTHAHTHTHNSTTFGHPPPHFPLSLPPTHSLHNGMEKGHQTRRKYVHAYMPTPPSPTPLCFSHGILLPVIAGVKKGHQTHHVVDHLHVCACVCVRARVYIFICVSYSVCVRVCIHAHTHTHKHTMHMHTNLHIRMHIYINSHTHTHTHTHTLNIHTKMYPHICMYTLTLTLTHTQTHTHTCSGTISSTWDNEPTDSLSYSKSSGSVLRV